jgi:hypothetical protein
MVEGEAKIGARFCGFKRSLARLGIIPEGSGAGTGAGAGDGAGASAGGGTGGRCSVSQGRLFEVLSAVLMIGNLELQGRDESSVQVVYR